MLFAYLTLIPVALIGSTLDPACAGSQCETGLLSDIVFTGLYVGCAAGMLAISGTLSLYFFRPTALGEGWIVRALVGTTIVLALTFFALFAVGNLVPAAVILAIGAASYGLLRRHRDEAERREKLPPPPQGPDLNGHGRLNGHAGR